MRRVFFLGMPGLFVCLLLSTAAWAGGHNAADYPLRVHIFQFDSHSHYYQRMLETVDGEGRGNLYENSQPRGFDFGYHCGDRLRVSPGYETYLARWKKPGQTLEILLPQFGKPGAAESCELKVVMKDSVYFKHNGLVGEEPIAEFKDWMDKHDYDPEHGKDEPVKAAPAPVPVAAPAAPTPASPAPAGPGASGSN